MCLITIVKYYIFAFMTIINGIKEETLIQRFIDGDRTAFELLFRYYYAGLVTFASRIILDSDEAEEIVQDFFVRMWTGLREIKNSASLKNYLFTCIKNRSLNHLKKEKSLPASFDYLFLQWVAFSFQMVIFEQILKN